MSNTRFFSLSILLIKQTSVLARGGHTSSVLARPPPPYPLKADVFYEQPLIGLHKFGAEAISSIIILLLHEAGFVGFGTDQIGLFQFQIDLILIGLNLI